MTLDELLTQARDAMTVKRVFGDPLEKDGLTILPVAAVRGGGGGGGTDRADRPGMGGGFGLVARPVGVYVIRKGNVHWQPAVDVNRVILGGQVIFALIIISAMVRARARRRMRQAAMERAAAQANKQGQHEPLPGMATATAS